MKTPKIIIAFLPVLMLLSGAASLCAQSDAKVTKKEEYRIKLVKIEDGKTITIDTTFKNREDMEKFHEENMKKFVPGDKHVEPFTIKIDKYEDREITVEGNDTLVRHQIRMHRIHGGDTTHDVLKLIPEDELRVLADEMHSTTPGSELKVVKIYTFCNINLTDPSKDEIENSRNNEIKNSAGEKALAINNLNVYPNPSSGKINIDFELPEKGSTQIIITDLQGKEVYKEEFNNDSFGLQNRQADLTTSTGGIYLLKIKNADKSVVKKLVIQQSAPKE